MRIVDGWYVNILIGRTWGFGWISILFIIITILSLFAAYNMRKPLFPVIMLYILGLFSFICAFHCKPVERIITEYKIECDDTAKVNIFLTDLNYKKLSMKHII